MSAHFVSQRWKCFMILTELPLVFFLPWTYFTKKDLSGIIFLKASLNSSCHFLFKEIKLHEGGTQEKLGKTEGVCFSYLFGMIIITSLLHQWPEGWVPDIIVSGLDLFQNPSFIILTYSIWPRCSDPWSRGQTLSLRNVMPSIRKRMLWTLGVQRSLNRNGY